MPLTKEQEDAKREARRKYLPPEQFKALYPDDKGPPETASDTPTPATGPATPKPPSETPLL